MSLFKEGQSVTALFFTDEQCIRVGAGECTGINVVMENGQMAGVPWFEVYKNGEVTEKWNAAMLEGVEI